MSTHDDPDTTPEELTDEELELVIGGMDRRNQNFVAIDPGDELLPRKG